jgi:hypothetical protein
MPTPRVTSTTVVELIRIVRGVEALLDTDVARLFDIDLRTLTDAVADNPNLFPGDFVFPADPWVAARPHAIAFTEHGVALLLVPFDTPQRALTVVEVLNGFTTYRRQLALMN